MKRLNAKKKKIDEKEVAKYVLQYAKENLDSFPDDVASYIKRSMKRYDLTIDELLDDDNNNGAWYELECIMKDVLHNLQGIYDSVVDKLFSDTPQEAHENDPGNPNSPAKNMIDDIISNFSDYGVDVKNLLTDKIKEKLKENYM